MEQPAVPKFLVKAGRPDDSEFAERHKVDHCQLQLQFCLSQEPAVQCLSEFVGVVMSLYSMLRSLAKCHSLQCLAFSSKDFEGARAEESEQKRAEELVRVFRQAWQGHDFEKMRRTIVEQRDVLRELGLSELRFVLAFLYVQRSPTGMSLDADLAAAKRMVVDGMLGESDLAAASRMVVDGGMHTGAVCGLCLEGFTSEGVIKVTGHCGHAFHEECIGRWLQTSATCPVCRQHFAPRSASAVGIGPQKRLRHAPYQRDLHFLGACAAPAPGQKSPDSSSHAAMLRARDRLTAAIASFFQWKEELLALLEHHDAPRYCPDARELGSLGTGSLTDVVFPLDRERPAYSWTSSIEGELLDTMAWGTMAMPDLQSITTRYSAGGALEGAVVHLEREYREHGAGELAELRSKLALTFGIAEERVEIKRLSRGSLLVEVRILGAVATSLLVCFLGLFTWVSGRPRRGVPITVARRPNGRLQNGAPRVRPEDEATRFLMDVVQSRPTEGVMDRIEQCAAVVVSGPGKSPPVFNLILDKSSEHNFSVAMVYFPGRDETATNALGWEVDWGANVQQAAGHRKPLIVLMYDDGGLGRTQRLEVQWLRQRRLAFRQMTVHDFLAEFCADSARQLPDCVMWQADGIEGRHTVAYRNNGVREEGVILGTNLAVSVEYHPLEIRLIHTSAPPRVLQRS